jgi:hypothetical protein
VKPHENIRVAVVEKLRRVLLDVLEEVGRMEESPRKIEANTLKTLLEDFPDFLPVLLPQEVGEGKYVDMTFSGRIIVELKGSRSEFGQAKEKAESLYLPKFEKSRYYILTDGEWFSLYEVRREGGNPSSTF